MVIQQRILQSMMKWNVVFLKQEITCMHSASIATLHQGTTTQCATHYAKTRMNLAYLMKEVLGVMVVMFGFTSGV